MTAGKRESPRFSITMHNQYDQYEKTSMTALAKLEEGGSGRCCSQKVLGTTLVALGALLVVISVLFSTVLPPVIDDTVRSGVVTCSTEAGNKVEFTDMYGDCDDCTPYYSNLYLFNVTNAEAHLALSTKLMVREVGPYVYRRRQMRLNVSVANNRVSYKQYTYHTFEPTLSCSGCSDQDQVIAYDAGYLNVIAQAGGEQAFLITLALGTFAKGQNVSTASALIAKSTTQMMKWVNGLNSLDPEAMKTVTDNSLVIKFLLGGPSALQNVTMDGFAYNGIFAKRSVSQWALGYPSLLAGLGLGANYVTVCQAGGMEKKCASCTGAECLSIYAECKKCATGKSVLAVNPLTCGTIQSIYASKYGEAEAKTFAAGTCGSLCTSSGLCAAPLPGAVETSGLDYSKSAPPADSLNTFTQRTGCDDDSVIGQYEMYDGVSLSPIWATLDSRRNPTADEIVAFASYGNCANPTSNLTCSKVQGGDGQSVAPGGVGISGFEDKVSLKTLNLYVDQIKFNISMTQEDSAVSYEGIKLHRFVVPTDLLSYTAEKAPLGTGYPVDGVQSLGFASGFLAYLSYPMYLYGDQSLIDNVTITMSDGLVATKGNLYSGDKVVKDTYVDKYMTFLDVEAGTGKTMRARKRLMASYSVSKSSLDPTIAMTDVLWPAMKPEVIVPVYWADESATIGAKQIDSYRVIVKLLKAMVPVLIVGTIAGIIVLALGIVKRRRAKQVSRAHASSII
ncbi:Croquemort-like mating [Globisporangium polare]